MGKLKCFFGFHSWGEWGKKLFILPTIHMYYAFCSRCQKSRTKYVVEEKLKETQ